MRTSVSVLALATLAFGLAGPATAGTVTQTFDFNNLGNNASTTTIATYMSTVLQGLGLGMNMVTVSGGIGQQGASSYAGEGFVTGPKMSGTVYPLTLANTDGSVSPNSDPDEWNSNPPTLSGTDGFVKNCTGTDTTVSSGATGCIGGPSNDIFFNFHGLQIESFSFDYQVFPDGTCPSINNCGGAGNPNLPDLTVSVGDNGGNPDFVTYHGVVPGSAQPGGTEPDGGTQSAGNTYTLSLNHPSSTNPETAPQLLSTSQTFTIANFTSNPVSTLDFMDWPETIGIDNLKITFKKTPEPSTIAIFAIGLFGLGWMVRRKRAHKAAAQA